MPHKHSSSSWFVPIFPSATLAHVKTIAAPSMSSSDSDDPADPSASISSASSRDVYLIVGTNLRRLRKSKGYSLERLAELSGVSRAMLGQIETGKSTPTVSLLWRIADALAIPVKTLLTTESQPDVLVLRRAGADVLLTGEAGVAIRDLMPRAENCVRFLEFSIGPGHFTRLPPAPLGTRQSLVVAVGRLAVEVGSDRAIELGEGDAAVFEASEPCTSRNPSGAHAIAYLVVLGPAS